MMPSPMQALGKEILGIQRQAVKAANRSMGARKGWETRRAGFSEVKAKVSKPSGYFEVYGKTGRHVRHTYADLNKARAVAQRQMTLKMKNGEFVAQTPNYGAKAIDLKNSVLAFNKKMGGGQIRENQIMRMDPNKLYFMMTRDNITLDVFFAYSPEDDYNIEQITSIDWLIERYEYYTDQGWL